jgi:CelD/BcsL family acetyltransferase involved in cellulose biosynthesis
MHVETRTGLHCELVTDFSRLESLSYDWEHLWHGAGRREIFSGFAWAKAWWRAFGAKHSLVTPVVMDGDSVVGILPLVVESGTLKFLGSPHADYNDILCEPDRPEVAESALRCVLQSTDWKKAVLENVSEGSRLRRLSEAFPRDLQNRLEWIFSSPCPAIVLTENRDTTLRSLLGKDSLRRHYNKLKKIGKLQFRHIEDRDEIREALPQFFQQHVARRAMAGGTSRFSDDASTQFYYHLVEELDPTCDLRFSVVELDGRPIAYHLGFELDGKLVWYKPSFDVDYWDYSPGEVLIRSLLEYVGTRSVEEIDFTVGDESFKGRFANEIRSNFTVRLFRPGLVDVTTQTSVRAKERFKQVSMIAAPARRVVTFLHALQHRVRRAGFRNAALAALKTTRRQIYASDEVLVYSIERENIPAGDSSWLPRDLEAATGSLSDLAALASAHPDFLDSGKLHQAKSRLKAGNELYIVRRSGELVHLAWLGMRETITAEYEVGPDCRLDLGELTGVIFDCWTPEPMRGQGIYPAALRALTLIGLDRSSKVWIYCLKNNHASRRGIEKAGFLLRHRMGSLKILSRRVQSWVRGFAHGILC